MSVPMIWTKFSFIPWTPRLLFLGLLLFAIPAQGLGENPILRKVMVLYNSESSQGPIKNNMVFECCQTILNYYGMLTDYVDASKRPLPGQKVMSGYRGIITTFDDDAMKGAKGYLTWLNRQFESQKRVVVLGRLGCTAGQDKDPDLRRLVEQTYQNMGLEYGGDYTGNQALLKYVYKDKSGVEFERKYPLFPPEYEKFTPLNKVVKTYLSIKRKDRKGSTSSLIITSPTGGFAHSDFIYWEDPNTFRKQWYLNPFLFFEEALDLMGLPIPDPTTLNGLRVAFSHIDGDAFAGISRIKKKGLCAEVIRDEILKKYDFPVTVSVIVGEIDPKALGNAGLVRLAREIFALPNVEPASHSYSHPFYWDPHYEYKYQYDRQYGIKIPGYTFDRKKEIDYSTRYITKELAPKGKPCKVLLWSGNCVPMESDIAQCDAIGVLNMNGGDTVFDNYSDSYTSVAPLYRKVGSRFQIYIGQANENILTNLWQGPYYGHRGIITTMKRTGYPRRIKPIDIYYHFYSGEYYASVKALQDIYSWVEKQEVAPVFTSDYIRMVFGYLKTRMSEKGPGEYIIEDYGDCFTVRFDKEKRTPDLKRCVNVLGYAREPQGLYFSLVPGEKRAIIALSGVSPLPAGPFLEKASGLVSGFQVKGRTLVLDFKGFGEGRVGIRGLEPETSFRVDGTALENRERSIETDAKGALFLEGLKTGRLEITPN